MRLCLPAYIAYTPVNSYISCPSITGQVPADKRRLSKAPLRLLEHIMCAPQLPALARRMRRTISALLS